jgi:hypothetical protein
LLEYRATEEEYLLTEFWNEMRMGHGIRDVTISIEVYIAVKQVL